MTLAVLVLISSICFPIVILTFKMNDAFWNTGKFTFKVFFWLIMQMALSAIFGSIVGTIIGWIVENWLTALS